MKIIIFICFSRRKTVSANYGYQVDLRDANAKEPIELLHDETNDYYYVEMGTYNGSPVRWKVVAVDGENYTYNASQVPSGELTFVLETQTTKHIFGFLRILKFL